MYTCTHIHFNCIILHTYCAIVLLLTHGSMTSSRPVMAGGTDSYPTTGKPEETRGLRVGDEAQHGGFPWGKLWVWSPQSWIHIFRTFLRCGYLKPLVFPWTITNNLEVALAIGRRKSWIYGLPGLRHDQMVIF